jgi:hypothetical protein
MTQYKSSAYGGAYQYGDMDKEEAGLPQYREPEMLGMDHSAKLERSMRLAFIRKVRPHDMREVDKSISVSLAHDLCI